MTRHAAITITLLLTGCSEYVCPPWGTAMCEDSQAGTGDSQDSILLEDEPCDLIASVSGLSIETLDTEAQPWLGMPDVHMGPRVSFTGIFVGWVWEGAAVPTMTAVLETVDGTLAIWGGYRAGSVLWIHADAPALGVLQAGASLETVDSIMLDDGSALIWAPNPGGAHSPVWWTIDQAVRGRVFTGIDTTAGPDVSNHENAIDHGEGFRVTRGQCQTIGAVDESGGAP